MSCRKGWINMKRSILALAVLGLLVAPSIAGVPLDPRETTLPTYLLPDSAAADGDLAEWSAIPSVPAANFKSASANETITPSDSFAPSLFCGMKKGSTDLYFLLIVRDSKLYQGDAIELYLDLGLEARNKQEPEWSADEGKWLTRKFGSVPYVSKLPEMGQLGYSPKTIASPAGSFRNASAESWKADCACVLVRGGVAYEIRIDSKSVLGALKLAEMPASIGLDFGINDQDYPLLIRTEGWSNEQGLYRLFGDAMDHVFTAKYGMLSTRPVAPPADQAVPLPKTRKALFGEFPDQEAIQKLLAKPQRQGPAAEENQGSFADLIYWAGFQGMTLSPKLVGHLMADDSWLVSEASREAVLAVMAFTEQEKDVADAAIKAIYSDIQHHEPNVLILANLVNEKYALGYRPQLRELLLSKDLTVAASAGRALAKAGTLEDIPAVEKVIADAHVEIPKLKDLPPWTQAGMIRVYTVFIGASLEELRGRVEPIKIPTATPLREVKAENTDLPRLMPLDNNNVYNAKGLLRTWPKDGPKELWRVEVGEGKSAVTEANGRAFTAAQFDGKQWALCLNPATGATIWKHEIYPKAASNIVKGPIVTPLVDGNRVYFIASADAGPYDPLSPVYCLNAEDGAEIWRSDDNEYASQGSATPLIVDDTLYIPAGKSGKGKILVAVDKLTGKLRWSVADPQKRDNTYGSAASPAYQIIDGIPQIICGVYGGAREAWGVSAKTGELYWSYQTPMHHSLISSPVATGSRVVLCGGQGSAAFSACLQMYVRDGKILRRQLHRDSVLQTNMYNTVAVLDGAVYGFGNESMQCTSLEDGKLLWKKAGEDWGRDQQLIIADGLIFALARKADLVMLEASKAGYKELGRIPTGLKLDYPQQPTIANGRLYVRGDTTIVCYHVAGK